MNVPSSVPKIVPFHRSTVSHVGNIESLTRYAEIETFIMYNTILHKMQYLF